MKITAIYDNGGKTVDRYTVMTDQEEWANDGNNKPQAYMALGLNEGGDGYSQFGGAIPGRHLGKKIQFTDLSANTQTHIAERIFGK
jgi:hypothetical protein